MMSKIAYFHLNIDLSERKSLQINADSNKEIRKQSLSEVISHQKQNDSIIFAISKTIQIRREDITKENDNFYLALFLPPSISSQIENILQKGDFTPHDIINTGTKQETEQNDTKTYFQWDSFPCSMSSIQLGKEFQELVSQIHPALLNFDIHGVFLADRTVTKTNNKRITRTASSDLMLFKSSGFIESKNTAKLDDYEKKILLDTIFELDGEPMMNANQNVIKIFRVSKICFRGSLKMAPSNSRNYSICCVKDSYTISFDHENDNNTHHDIHELKKLQGIEIPSCPVCQHRIDPVCLGFPPTKSSQVCAQMCLISNSKKDPTAYEDDLVCQNRNLLTPWSFPSCCVACKIIENHQSHQMKSNKKRPLTSKKSDSAILERLESPPEASCYECGMKETLWVCLICGFVGCGRYSQFHAGKHYHESGHCFALELATQRIWDYAADCFVQRIDFLTCPLINRNNTISCSIGNHNSSQTSYTTPQPVDSSFTQQISGFQGHHPNPSRSSQFHNNPPKKTLMISEEYEALIQSALEDQAQHFEGEISRLRAELTAQHIDEEKISGKESQEIEELQRNIQSLRSDVDCLGRELLEGQAEEAMLRTRSKHLLREQADSQEMLNKVRAEASMEHEEGKSQVEDLEQQIKDLTANLRMMQQFAQNEELCNAQIFGAASKASKRGKKK